MSESPTINIRTEGRGLRLKDFFKSFFKGVASVPGKIHKFFFPPQIIEDLGGYQYVGDCRNADVTSLFEIADMLESMGKPGRDILNFSAKTILERHKRQTKTCFTHREGDQCKKLVPDSDYYKGYKLTKNIDLSNADVRLNEGDGTVEVNFEVIKEELKKDPTLIEKIKQELLSRSSESKEVAVTVSDGKEVENTTENSRIEGWN